MAIYYSATTNSFYDSNIIEITQMPEDSKIVTDANYKALMDAQCDGHVITANSDGTPCAITQQCGPCSGLIHDLTIATANKLGHVKGGGNVSIDANGVVNANIDLSGYALDSNVVHKSGNETINGVKSFGGAIKATNGTVQVGADTGYNVTFNYNGNITSKQARGTYNIFFPEGSGTLALTSDINGKANDSDVVHKTGDETINGIKTFTSGINFKNNNIDLTVTPSSTLTSYFIFKDKNDQNVSFIQYAKCNVEPDILGLYINDTNKELHGIQITSNNYLLPIRNNIYSLGSPNNKWANVYSTNDITNTVITYSVTNHNDTSSMTVCGGPSWDKGSTLFLHGNSHAKYPGVFELTAKNTTNESRLIGFPNGTLTWGGKSLAIDDSVVHRSGDETIAGIKTFSNKIKGNLQGNADTATSADNGVDSYGNSWIRFKNGIQMCWGYGIHEETISYPKAFISGPKLICTAASDTPQSLVINFYLKTNTQFACRLWNVQAADWHTSIGLDFDWIAIGTWK